MGAGQSKEIPKASPLGCVIAHRKDVAGHGGTENKRDLIRFCKDWWPLWKLGDGAKWPPRGILDYNTLLQFMLFLRREGKGTEVSYADMFFVLEITPNGRGIVGSELHLTLWYWP